MNVINCGNVACVTCLTSHLIKCFVTDRLAPKSKFLFFIKQHFPNQTIFTICETREFIILSKGAFRLYLSREWPQSNTNQRV